RSVDARVRGGAASRSRALQCGPQHAGPRDPRGRGALAGCARVGAPRGRDLGGPHRLRPDARLRAQIRQPVRRHPPRLARVAVASVSLRNPAPIQHSDEGAGARRLGGHWGSTRAARSGYARRTMSAPPSPQSTSYGSDGSKNKPPGSVPAVLVAAVILLGVATGGLGYFAFHLWSEGQRADAAFA